MKTIAKKSAGEMVIVSIFGAMIIPLFFIILMIALERGFNNGIHVTFYVAILLALYVIYIFIMTLSKPNILIQYDNNQIYLHYRIKHVSIPISSIIGISPKRTRIKGFRTEFGKVIIRTKDHKYTMDNVDNCEDVAIEITMIKEEFVSRST